MGEWIEVVGWGLWGGCGWIDGRLWVSGWGVVGGWVESYRWVDGGLGGGGGTDICHTRCWYTASMSSACVLCECGQVCEWMGWDGAFVGEVSVASSLRVLPQQIQLEQFGASRRNIVMSDATQDNQLVIGCQDVSTAHLPAASTALFLFCRLFFSSLSFHLPLFSLLFSCLSILYFESLS